MSLHSPGKAFRAALTKENPLQIVGTINANHALLAQRAGYQAIYLSADRHSPYHRRLFAAAAGGCGYRFWFFGL